MHRFLLIAVLIAFLAPSAAAKAASLLEVGSPHPVAATMDRLEAVVKARGFKVFLRLDHQKGAQSVGQELRPTELLIFGNPRGGTPLMLNAQTMAIDLPLKALVYEDAGGAVHIAFNDPSFLVARHELTNSAAIVERMTGLLKGLAAAAIGDARTKD